MTLTYNNNTENSYIYTYTIEEYTNLLNNGTIRIDIDSTNFNCNTCDSIFEQVFDFVNKNYKDNDVDRVNRVQPNNLLDILKKKATDTLQTQINKKLAGEENNK